MNTSESNEPLKKYLQQMAEIRKRNDVVANILSQKCTTGFRCSDIEICVLQFRKIIELIAMGGIITNYDQYSQTHDKFCNNWNARLIFQDIERINPGFYPQPISIEKHYDRPDVFIPVSNGFLTKEDAIKLYEKCGAFLHADNPYKSPVDINYYETNLTMWNSKIIRLLNVHLVKLIDGNMYYVVMNSVKDGCPAGNLFEKQ